MGWHGHLDLHYRADGPRTIALDRHDGPLRVLQRLYPEGEGICHHVLVHPPGGMVGGDILDISARVEPGCHALITTPAAARFYRSAGERAEQRVAIEVHDGARLEWLPLETLAYDGCLGLNLQRFHLQGRAQMFGWDLLALGLPAAGLPYARGRFEQHLELPGVWLERGTLDAGDLALLDSPLGLDGQSVIATLWFATAQPIDSALRDGLLASAREIAAAGPLAARSGATAPQPEVVVLRALAPRVEPAFQLLRRVWSNWRQIAWQLDPCAPRVWST